MSAFYEKLTHLRTYDEHTTQAAFLLGGIGTGNVSVGSRGQLRDWEIFGRPGKGNKFPYTFFAMHVDVDGECANRVLEAPIQPPYALSHGFDSGDVCGLPRMRSSTMRAEYPLVSVELKDDALPVSVVMEAYTPFIPLDVEDSSIPGAIIRYRVKNHADKPAFVSVAGSMANMTTAYGYGDFNYVKYAGPTKNTAVREDGLQGVHMESIGFAEDHPMNATLSLMTTNEQATIKPVWFEGAWFDCIQDFWDDFSSDGVLAEENSEGGEGNQLMRLAGQRIGSVAPNARIMPDDEYVFEFILTWHFPNRVLGWGQDYDPECKCGPDGKCETKTVKNHYALKYVDSLDVANYIRAEMPRLEQLTLDFHEALFESTLPVEVLDAVSANITVLRSTTCFRIEDGTFLGWEGCFDKSGCCDGTCTHVWNYAQTLAFLFPELEQSMRRNEFMREVEADGKMNFRSRKVLEESPWDMHPAVDGQTGSIIRLYREWNLSGDDELIFEMGHSALAALDFSIAYWDSDGDGVLDNQQHNTYDIEFYGPNSLANSMFFAALKAGSAIAAKLGQPARAEDYMRRFREGSARMDQLLWGGEYYIQQLQDVNKYKYQYGKGCLSDQILGQYMAHVAGLGYILPEEHVKQTAESVYRYNFRHSFRNHENAQRTYALEDEEGLLLCSWPEGGRPRFPFVYSDEVWTGIEYQVAATLIYEGYVEEGVELVRAVRARHDGVRRNPFNEVECGHHYARSMASWAVLTALSGYHFDMGGNESFAPRIHADDFKCFFSTANRWGVYSQKKNDQGELVKEMKILYERS